MLYDTQPVVARAVDAAALRRSWVVQPGGLRMPFDAPVLQYIPGGWWVRFNTACMRPVGSGGDAVLRLISGRVIVHRWQPAEALVFDNWRFLHAREAALHGIERRMERLIIR